MPARLTASGVTVPALSPVSQYFDSRRPCVSANTNADPSAVGVSPLAKYSPATTCVHGAVRVATEQAAAAACLEDRAHVVTRT